MASFFENLEPDDASEIDSLSKLAYELRENQHAVLKRYDVEDAATLLLKIHDGTVAEHPAYEHYLAARILADTRETVRTVIGTRLKEAQQK